MPKLDDLYKAHKGQDIYIIGTGPSLSLFPKNWLNGKISIGLNQAYKTVDTNYNLTIHPYLIPIKSKLWNKSKWITKTKISDESWKNHLKEGNIKLFYLFKNPNNPLDFTWLHPTKRPPNCLYVGCGIQTGGLHLAALMGAKNVFLLGCDFDYCGFTHHCHSQHTEFHNHTPEEVYQEYYLYTEKVRQELESYYKINIFQLSYSLGIPKYTEKLLGHKNLLQSSPPVNIEKNVRTTPLISDFF